MPRALTPNVLNDDLADYYLDIIDAMPNIVYLLDRHCTLQGSNKQFRELFGLANREEAKGLPPYTLLHTAGHWSNERVEMVKSDDINVILTGKALHDIEEAPVVNAKNEVVYYLSSRIPLQNQQNEVIGLVVIFKDNTEVKRLKEHYKRIKKELQFYNNQTNSPENPTNNKVELANKKTPKVLMVEDNSIAQRAAQGLLMQLDCHVDVADSGDKATKLFEPGKYDLVFMDIGLEDTSGYVVSKKIRQLEKGTNHHVPIIALTGFEAEIVKYDCDDYSMEGALTKPLTSEQAKQIIQHYIYHIDIPVEGLKTIKDQMS